ncbi:MAG: type II toxin-antitoxin system RelE/ParE family toxin [Spirochaetaceae bacterium]|nr:type II toxin-antitoxin system RelE/ParE family toxin [Spirochaetaceae bacterium]
MRTRALKSIKKISEPYKSLIKSKIELLVNFSNAMPNIKALQGEYKGLYRLRVGDYRVLFETLGLTITVINVFARAKGY